MNKFLFVFMTLALCIAACSHNDNNVKNQDENDIKNELVIPTDDGIIPNAVTDIDGNTYKAVKLGDQIWMAENLKTKRYADGTSIYAGANESESEDVGYWYYPDGQVSNMSTYGLHYNWKAVVRNNPDTTNCNYRDIINKSDDWRDKDGGIYSNTTYRIYSNPVDIQGVCPNGWHVPSDDEWTQLTDYVSSQSQYVCGDDRRNIAKALASTTNWENFGDKCDVGHDKVLNNSTGFEALPYSPSENGNVYFWSSTIVMAGKQQAVRTRIRCPHICCAYSHVEKSSEVLFEAYPVRCIRNNNQ